MQLLGSVHPECRLASGAMLHLKARRDASSLASVDALALLSRCLEALSGTARTLRAQLTVAAAHLASRALAGPEGLPALPAFAALPPAQRVELLGSLPLAWPPERLRTSLPAVLALLTSLVDTEATGSSLATRLSPVATRHSPRSSRPSSPPATRNASTTAFPTPQAAAPLSVAACAAAWQPLGADLTDLGALVRPLALALRPHGGDRDAQHAGCSYGASCTFSHHPSYVCWTRFYDMEEPGRLPEDPCWRVPRFQKWALAWANADVMHEAAALQLVMKLGVRDPAISRACTRMCHVRGA